MPLKILAQRGSLVPMTRGATANSLLAALLLISVGGRHMFSTAAFAPRVALRVSILTKTKSVWRTRFTVPRTACGLKNMAATASAFPTSDRVQTTLDPCVILMKQLISKHAHLWEDRDGIYSLAQGVVYWKPPRNAYDALTDAAENDDLLHTYCPDEGLPELIDALKTKVVAENGLGGENGNEVEIIVTSGANQAYVNCVLTLLSEGDRCVVFRPYYFNHVMAVQMTRGEESLLVGSCGDNGVPDLGWLEEQFKGESGGRIKAVTLVNPGNPTGTSLSRSVLDEMVRLCRKHKAWLLMDNTYEHFDHTKANGINVPFWCSPESHVINIFSFSKAFALAGFRVGYIAINTGAGEEAQEAYSQMLKVQDTIPICPARPSQVASLGALSAGRDWVAEQVKTLDGGREAIMEALRPLGTIMGGTGAMYVMAKLPDGLDDREVGEILVEKYGIAIIPGSFCGFPGWIRVCYSNLDPNRCMLAAERLAEGIRDLINRK
uniref:Aminotransferase class I/classII large domain-containing protein n=1 Tax=Odontella aurita TaxID=265563 RepID=A0A7S4HNF3_9STRA|mmetsp:Transcript_12757/g.37539  ORF Transcript_12757/g.37539 Transcript_12757/m.37539 type:complete len:492 (+) Transcript_12757:137-1612(+)